MDFGPDDGFSGQLGGVGREGLLLATRKISVSIFRRRSSESPLLEAVRFKFLRHLSEPPHSSCRGARRNDGDTVSYADA